MLNSLLPWLAVAGLLPYDGLSQSVASTTDEGVPVGVPISGNYSGLYRPQVHFSPPKGFMNDPNGLFRDSNGTWHLYYQYNPTALVAGNQHWGHATSPDLYHWMNQPIALFPPNSSAQVFSGSAVVDTNNTSGFFPNQTNGVVAVYTLNTPTEQTQEIAYSRDGGYNFTMYSGNPVLRVNSNQFRDPKVFWYDDHWVMVVSFAVDFTIGIYTSDNLKNWTFGSNFTHHGLLGLQYECPNLVQVPVNGSDDTAWIMAISINPGAPPGGSITQYFPGTFNGTHFEPFDRAARIADFGKDNYAGQWFYGLPSSEAVSLGWASNWQYTNVVPTGAEGWRSAMSVPRRNFLTNATRIGYVLASAPYDLSPVLGSSLGSSSSLVNSSLSVDLANLTSNALYFSANISIPSNASASSGSSLNVTFTTTSSNETLALGYFFGGDNGGAIWIDRGGLNGFSNPFFTDKFSLTQVGTAYRIEGVLDRSLLEVFVDDGTFSATNDIYPTEPLTKMSVATTGIPDGSQISVGVWGLKSVWNSSST